MKKNIFLGLITLILSNYGYSSPTERLQLIPTKEHGSKSVEEIKHSLEKLQKSPPQAQKSVPPPVKISPKLTADPKEKGGIKQKFLPEKIKAPQTRDAESKSQLVAEIKQVLQQSQQTQEQEQEKSTVLPPPQIKKDLPSVAAIKDFIEDHPQENAPKKADKAVATQQNSKTDKPKTTTIRSKIIANGKKLIGIPYLFGGSTRAGFDCSGLVQYVYKQQGINVPRTSRHQFAELKPVKKPQPGDLVFFRHGNRPVNHVGIYIGDNKMLHAPSTGKTVQIVDIDTKYWKRRYAGARQALGNYH